MARIHYVEATGNVEGVHDGDDCSIHAAVPAGRVFLDVAGPPDKIAWPRVGGRSGREQWTRVVAGALMARDDVVVPPPTKAEIAATAIDTVLADITVSQSVKDALAAVKAALPS